MSVIGKVLNKIGEVVQDIVDATAGPVEGNQEQMLKEYEELKEKAKEKPNGD